ncbi:MAG: hypothetical protein WC358_04790 [Ignavibacteria bacterium]|jgi:hypothetical protein
MIDHLVIDILKSFSSEEIKQFRRFLSSPYFVRSETVVSLFNLLIKYYPNFNSKKLTKEYLSTNIFASEKYNDSTVRNALSDLQDTCELFMTHENFRKSATFSFDFLLKELRDKKLGEVFKKNSAKLDKQFSSANNIIDSEYYLTKHKFELNKFNYYSLNEKVNDSSEADLHFNQIYSSGLYLTIHYIIEIVSIYLTSVFYSIQYNRPITNNFLYKLISILNIRGLENLIENSEHNFIIKIYISLLKTFQNLDDEKAYLEYKNIFRSNMNKLNKDEIWFHYSNLINYCMIKVRDMNNKELYDSELFTLYQEVLQNDYYKNSKSDYLRFTLYRDILFTGLRQKKINWVENFILNQSSKLHKSDKDNMMNLAYAYLYYEKGEYMQSWKYFNKIKIDYFFFKFDLKNYALKIYFELGYYEEALTLIENYKKFLDRNDLMSESERNRTKSFITYLSKLILFKAGQIPYKQFSTYRRRLELANDISNRNWILNKYEAFASEIKHSRKLKSA